MDEETPLMTRVASTREGAALLLLLIVSSAGCVSGGLGGASEGGSIAAADARAWQRVHVFDGELRAVGDAFRSPFDVPEGAAEIEALLTWSDATAQLAFRLLDPSGDEVATGWSEANGRAYVTTTHPVASGEWTIEIEATRALLTAFAATVTVHSEAVNEGPIVTTFTIPARNPARALPPDARGALPSAGPRDFAEINLNMAPEDKFAFSWNATSEVYFNVHFHGADGTTERPIEERTTALQGNFVANATEVYALLWRNEASAAVEVAVELDGAYRLHSMTRGP